MAELQSESRATLRRVVIFVAAFLLIGSWSILAHAQERQAWCGYALIRGLPVLDHQLTVLEAITPARSRQARPNELFQYRFNLARTEVIIEGCWQVEPTRDMMLSLLTQAFAYDEKMIDAIGGVDQLLPPGTPIPVSLIVRTYIDRLLAFERFAPGASAEASAAAARDYISSRITEWERPEDEPCAARDC